MDELLDHLEDLILILRNDDGSLSPETREELNQERALLETKLEKRNSEKNS